MDESSFDPRVSVGVPIPKIPFEPPVSDRRDGRRAGRGRDLGERVRGSVQGHEPRGVRADAVVAAVPERRQAAVADQEIEARCEEAEDQDLRQ